MNEERFSKVISAIDQAHQSDPNFEKWEGKDYPVEYLNAIRMTQSLDDLYPNASEALKIACRCHHIYRWKIPRSEYPMNKVGYHQWRNTLKKYHAVETEKIMASHDYDSEIIEETKKIIEKRQLKLNPDSQAMEDVICIVFLKYGLHTFGPKYDESKVIDILTKTWHKMSDYAQSEALKLELPAYSADIVKKALAL